MRVLVIDDDEKTCRLLETQLGREGFLVSTALEGPEGLRAVRDRRFDVVVMDLALSDPPGIEILEELRNEASAPEVIVMTDEPGVDSAVGAMKLGAHDYVAKPLDLVQLTRSVWNAAERRQLVRENTVLKHLVSQVDGVSPIVSDSDEMQKVLAIVDRVASSTAPVLITGETGTGKGLIAKTIHRCSTRAKDPIVAINCAGIQETLLESELFGHEKGSFTGAERTKPGLFEVADSGTLFLDEIAEMSMTMQAKLLQVLDEGEFRRVGGTAVRRVDVRVVAATNRDLQRRVREERFREDLYYRLDVVRVTLPPLRDRREDIPGLVRYYLGRHAPPGERPKRISSEAMQLLCAYSWPGNVREVSNTIEGMVLLATGDVLRPKDLPGMLKPVGGSRPASSDDEPLPLSEIQRLHILRTLDWTGGKKAQAARLLGINVKTLNNKLKSYRVT